MRGRLSAGKLDNPVWRIHADPHTQAALVVLRNADGYYARGTGPVRPRWLSKLRGLQSHTATWVRVPSILGSRTPETTVALIGTAFGTLFSLKLDSKYERDDTLNRLWTAPNKEKIDGIRIEYIPGKFIGTVATTSTLYLFSDAPSLESLFDENNVTIVNRAPDLSTKYTEQRVSFADEDLPLPSELQFMTGTSGAASRRFVWAASSGVTHALLHIRRRRNDRRSDSESDISRVQENRSTVETSVVEKETISWTKLKETSGSAVPLACNLSPFHVLVLYPGSVFAFNQISCQLTQRITIWSPNGNRSSVDKSQADWPLGVSRQRRGISPTASEISSNSSVRSLRDSNRVWKNWDDGGRKKQYLSSPASGFARDVLMDAIWIYTEDGEFARLIVDTHEEQVEAWKAAKAMGRFQTAVALAQLISSGLPDDNTMTQTIEEVQAAQANEAAAKGNWDVAARLYAKTNRPIESVILDIVEAGMKQDGASSNFSSDDLRSLGIGTKNETIKYVITYLVRKLDKMESSRPMQKTIIATMLVQLYSSLLCSEIDRELRKELRKDFGHFLADKHGLLETGTALGILRRNGCFKEAWDLAILSGDILTASELLSRRGKVDEALSLLKEDAVVNNSDMLSQLVNSLSNTLVTQAPQKATTAMSRALKKDSQKVDHMVVVQGLARVARELRNEEKSREAYQAVLGYLFDLLQEWKPSSDIVEALDEIDEDDTPRDWHNLITFLFQLHTEFGRESEAQRSYDHLVAPHTGPNMSDEVKDAVGLILRSCIGAGFFRLCVYLYQALGLHKTGISLAVKIDIKLAETMVSQVCEKPLSDNLKRELWCMVAARSDDAVGVVERSRGVLHIEDVLINMAQFESATERVKAAVANSLEEHKQVASAAKSDTTSALQVTKSLREDLERAQAWQKERKTVRHHRRYQAFSCGHRMKAMSQSSGTECMLCGEQAILSVDAAFDSGITLPKSITEEAK